MSFRIGSREREFAMPGGVAHRGQVVRVGDTVRRPPNPGSRAIHALLEYLHDVGFDGVARSCTAAAAMNLPIAVWMIRSFLIELPKEVLEAARVDGAKLSTEMRRIIVPMVAPGLTATQAATVRVFLVGFITSEGQFRARLSAASTMAVLPVIIAGWVAQKWLVRGLSLGAVK